MNKRVIFKLPWRVLFGKSSLIILVMILYALYCLFSAIVSFVGINQEKSEPVTLFCTYNDASDTTGNRKAESVFDALDIKGWTACKKKEMLLEYKDYSMSVCLVALEKDYLENVLSIQMPSYSRGQMPYIILNKNSLSQMENAKHQKIEILSEENFILKTFAINENVDVRLYDLTDRQIVLTDQFFENTEDNAETSESIVYAYTTMPYLDEIIENQMAVQSKLQSENQSMQQMQQSELQENAQYMLQLVSSVKLEQTIAYLEKNGFNIEQSEQFGQMISQWSDECERAGNRLKLAAVICICIAFLIYTQKKRWVAEHPYFVSYLKISANTHDKNICR